ncbi:MAG: ABC transporter permease [Burkholderiales bacterium]|nr:ABC transporter permease [Burkholderiales bacterium]
MSAVRRIAVVAAKEVRETLRDRRTLLVLLITAVAAGPVFLFLIFNLIARQADRTREIELPAVNVAQAPALADFLRRNQVRLVDAPASYEAKLRAGDLDVVLVVDPDFAAEVDAGRVGTVQVVADRSRDRARPAVSQVESLVRAYGRQWGSQRLLLRGVAASVGEPLRIEEIDLATPQQSGAIILFLVAYYALLGSFMGGMAVALDLTAGERERQSLEPLLMTPARPLEIVLGKWLAVSAFNALVVVITLAGFYLTLAYAPLPAVGVPFLFGSREFARFLVVLLPLVLLMPAILLYVGSRGRTFKEAQANVSLLMFVASIVPAVQIFTQQREPAWFAAVPVSGQYSLLSHVLRGEAIAPAELALSYAIPSVLIVVALGAMARLLARAAAVAGK